MTAMKQLERIAAMEAALNRARAAVDALDSALDAFRGAQQDLAALSVYYEGGDWRRDYEDDEAGRIPVNLPRGVLSQDAVYDLLADAQELENRLNPAGGALTVMIRYTGENGSARRFMEEMEASGTAAAVRAEPGNLRYEYLFPADDPESVVLIDRWRDQAALDAHHASPMMAAIAALREKYHLRAGAERFAQLP